MTAIRLRHLIGLAALATPAALAAANIDPNDDHPLAAPWAGPAQGFRSPRRLVLGLFRRARRGGRHARLSVFAVN